MYNTRLKEIKKQIYATYLEGPRDQKLRAMLRAMVENVSDCFDGGGSRQRALFLIGNSGSGKTFSLKHHFALIQEFQPFQNEYGETVNPLLSIEAPKPCTMKGFAIAVLEALGLPANTKQTEGSLYVLVKAQIKARGVLYLHVDEAQHLIRHNSTAAIQDVQDGLKSLMQIPDWPLHIICSGVNELAHLLQNDQQLANRSRVLRYREQSPDTDKEWIEAAIQKIAVDISGLKVPAELLEDDFIGRLCHASMGGFGKIVETVQTACILALQKDKPQLETGAFAQVYQDFSGCLPGSNIFRVPRWSEISPQHVLADLPSIGTKKGGTKQ